MYGFLRVACAVPDAYVSDVEKNTAQITEYLKKAAENKADLAVFPELCLTGYTCADLFFRPSLVNAAYDGLTKIAKATENINTVCLVGLPVRVDEQLYNCAAVVSQGKIRAIVPKTYIPTYNEFYEKRWFSSSFDLPDNGGKTVYVNINGEDVPVGTGFVFDMGQNVKFGVEICEDLWAPVPPSSALALSGALLVANLSASNETIAKRSYRRSIVAHQSAACLCAYAYASAGRRESTTDLIFSGHSVIASNGNVLCENTDYIDSGYVIYSDIDLDMLRHERAKLKTFKDCAKIQGAYAHEIIKACDSHEFLSDASFAKVNKLPFVPDVKTERRERCANIFDMQVYGLLKRLEITHSKPVIGVSGGLDSTLALLVCAMAVKKAGKPASDVVGVTMPCFGTTDRTYDNSVKLMKALGVTLKVIPIKDAVRQHFSDIGHDESVHDLTYENSQARERTQVLMDVAGEVGGLVVGTGDLSELALGWCTYNADHMSMYGVNASIPKTLIRWLIDSVCENNLFPEATDVLRDVMDTPISPELLPPDENGKIAQKTEDVVGPYALHDFFLYYTVRFGMDKDKILFLAKKAFEKDFDEQTVVKWLDVFMRRFRTQQFKRSCLPDGVKVGSICLSPRGDWRMPSDADAII